MRTTDLTLNLFAGPACGLDGPGGEFSILSSILDHCGEPFLAIKSLELAVWERICKITGDVSLLFITTQF